MKKYLLPILFIVIGIALLHRLGLFSFLFNSNAEQKREDTVAVTLFPIADIARNIAGNDIKVVQILPLGASPHTFEPTPAEVTTVGKSQVVYAIGHGLDNWASTMALATGTPLLTLDKNISLRTLQEDEGDAHEEADGDGTDPHYWLSIPNAKIIAQTIADDLSERFPAHREAIQDNFSDYAKKLDDADKEIRDTLKSVTNRNIVTFHDALYYFAHEYDLTIVATAEPTPGIEPSPQYLSILREAIIEAKVKTIYIEPTLSANPILPFAKDENLTIATLDPEGAATATSFIDMMKTNAKTIKDNQ